MSGSNCVYVSYIVLHVYGVYIYVYVWCVSVSLCVHVCVFSVCTHACMRVCVCVCVWCDTNICIACGQLIQEDMYTCMHCL